MEESQEEFEPLFDYTRVQPCIVCLDDDDSDSSPICPPKRRKIADPIVETEVKHGGVVQILDCDDKEKEEEEEDWLPPPPKITVDPQKHCEDPTIKALRLQKQELMLFAQSAQEVLRTVEESVRRDLEATKQSSSESLPENPSKPASERPKIVISIQDKTGLKQFRVYMDDKFERLFKMYAEKVKLDLQSLAFCFDGDKISPTATPESLGMEDNDIIEVHAKSN